MRLKFGKIGSMPLHVRLVACYIRYNCYWPYRRWL